MLLRQLMAVVAITFFVCKDKSNIDIPSIIKEVNSWRNKKLYVISREWAYRGAKQSRIVVEKILGRQK